MLSETMAFTRYAICWDVTLTATKHCKHEIKDEDLLVPFSQNNSFKIIDLVQKSTDIYSVS